MGSTSRLSEEQRQLRQQIEQTRRDLGQTIEALTAKAAVGQRVEDKVHHQARALQARGDQLRERTAEIGQQVGQAAPARLREVAGRSAMGLADHPVAVGSGVLLLVLAIAKAARRG